MKSTVRFLFLLIVVALFPFLANAQLSGSYTIGGSGASYSTISAAVSALNSSGTSGPVKFTVADGSYSGPVRLSGSSIGHSVIFEGSDSSKCTLSGYSSSSTGGVWEVDNVDSITIKNITIRNTNTRSYGSAVRFDYTDASKVINCRLITRESPNYAYQNCAAYLYAAENCEIINTRVYGGYYGIYLYGTSTSTYNSSANKIEGCKVVKAYSYAIYNYRSESSQIHSNVLDSNDNGFAYHLYSYQSTNTSIQKNKIYFTGTYYAGIYLYYENYYGASSNRSLLANNFVGGNPTSYIYGGIYLNSYTQDCDVLNNTIYSKTATSTSYACLRLGTSSTISGHNIQNNNFHQGASGGVALYVYRTAQVDTCDYNNVYSSGSNIAYFNLGLRSNLTALKGVSGSFNQNSISTDIGVSDYNDFSAQSAGTNNKGNKWTNPRVLDDINGNSRPTSPDTDIDIGCNDYYLPPNDAGIAGFPSAAFCAGTATAEAILKNYGTSTLTACTVNWAISVDGGSFQTQSSKSFSGSLSSGSESVFTLGNFTMQGGKSYTIKSWTSSPNSSTDGKNSNDTSYTTMAPALAGTFAIGSGGDYSTIGSAINALSANGVCGPVTLRLTDAAYNERVIIPELSGSSSTNYVRIVGAGASSTKISHSATGTSDIATILLDGADFVIIDSLTIEANGGSYGSTVWFTNAADSNQVTNCQLLGSAGSTSSNRSNVVFSNSTTSYSGTGNSGNYNTIKNNLIRGGYFGLSQYASTSSSSSTWTTGMWIENNEFYRCYYGMYFRGSSNKKIIGNKVDSNGYMTFYNYYSNADSVVRNILNTESSAYYNMYNYFNNYYGASSTDTSYFINNMISNGGTYNLISYYNYRCLWYNNSFSSGASYTAYFVYPYYSEFKNNTFQNTSSGYALYINSTSNIANGAIGFNNYYAPNASNQIYYGTNYTNYAAWQMSVITQNTGSISADPQHVSATDLSTLSPNLNNVGIPLWQVTDDIDGDSRPTSPDKTPDIGADDYYLPPYDLDIISVTPGVMAKGKNGISITVRNTGLNDILGDTAYVSYARGNETPTVDSIHLVNLYKGNDTTFWFADSLIVVADTSFNFCATIDSGIVGDPDVNEQVCINPCIGSIGTYTIDAAGGGDFKTFAAAIASLNGCGVAGNVTFEVEAGTYNEQVELSEINGAGENARISFINAGSGQVLISNSGSNNTNWITVLLDGADYISFNGIDIEAKGSSYGCAVFLTNSADYNRFENCSFIAAQSTSYYNEALILGGNTSNYYTNGNSGNYNVFVNNDFNGGGYYGVIVRGSSTSSTISGNQFWNNTFQGSYYYPMYNYYSSEMKIVGNTLSPRATGTYSTSANGLYHYYGRSDSIASNYLSAPRNALYMYFQNYYGSSSDTGYVVNNMIVGGTYTSANTVYMYYSDRVYVVGNSVLSNSSYNSSSYAAVELYYCDYNTVRNNTISRPNGGYAFQYYYGISPNLDNNNYYAPNSSLFIYYNGSTYSSVAAYASGSSQESNSLEVDPEYTSATDLRTVSINLNNKGQNMPRFNVDFDGNARPAAPDAIFDIGASEYYLPDYDADVIAIGPKPLTVGSNSIEVTVKNNGIKTWNATDTLYLEYSVDGSTAVQQQFLTGAIAPGGTATYTFSTSYSASADIYKEACAGMYKWFKRQDPDTLNEEFCEDLCVAGATSLVVDANGSGDFRTINEAVDYLSCAGVSNSVRILVKDGIYDEQVTFPNINGASNANRIRFVGESSDAVITHTAAGTGADLATVTFDYAHHITLDSLTIEAKGSSYGWAVHLWHGSDNNNITNCLVETPTSTSSYVAPIMASNSQTSAFSYADNADSTIISGNQISGGYYGIRLNGRGSTTQDQYNMVLNNTFSSQYYYGLYYYYQNDILVNGNEFGTTGTTSGYGVYSYYSNRVTISNNVVSGGTYGIAINFGNYGGTSTSDTSYVVNNMIRGFSNTSNQRGIYAYYADRTKILHNSVITTHSTTSTAYASLYMTNSDNCIAMNNVFANTSGGLTFYQSGGTVPSGSIDYNNYYAPNSSYLAYQGGYRADLAAWQTSNSTYNASAISIDPAFISSTDLHSFNDNINNKGNNFHSWPTDFDGDPRPTSPDTKVDLGADDFWIPLYDADVLSVDSPEIVINGNNTITTTIQNRGLRNLTGENVVVSYTINNGTPEYDTIACKFIKIGGDTVYTFNTPWNNSLNSNFDICVSVDTILGRTSDQPDQVCIQRCTGVSDTIWVDPTGNGDYLTIAGAVNKLNCGIVGPTVVYIKNGTYNESATLGSFKGISATNNIKIIGESRNGVIWENDGAYSTVLIDNAAYLSISNLTIQNSGTASSAGNAVLLTGASHNIDFDNVTIEVEHNATNSGVASLVASAASGGFYTGLTAAYDVAFSNSDIIGGYYNTFLIGKGNTDVDTNLVFDSCNFKHYYNIGIYAYQQGNLQVSNCSIDSSAYAYNRAIYSYYSSGGRFENNRITTQGTGIYSLYSNYAISSRNTEFVNNVLYQNNNNFIANYGIYNNLSYNCKYYNNTIVSTTQSTSSSGAAIYLTGTATNVEFKNNNVYAENGGYLIYNVSSSISSGAIDNNNWYSPTSFNAYSGGSWTSLGAWQSVETGYNQNSVSVNPYFNSTSDFHAGSRFLMNAGDSLGIAMDFDGEMRNLNNPDIGADEISKDMSVTTVTYPLNACRTNGDLDSVKIIFQNTGVSSFVPGDTFYVSFMEGSVMHKDTLIIPSGMVFSNGMINEYKFDSMVSNGSPGSHNLSAWGSYFRDADMSNDTFKHNYYTNPTPMASFTVAEQCEYETIEFKDGSTVAIGKVTGWEWNFGDGSSSTSQNPSNDYGVFDTFAVIMVATTDSGCTDTTYGQGITHPKPIAKFSTANECHHTESDFTNASTVAYGTLSYAWDMGDGTNTSTTTNPSLTYANDGSYNVELIATSDKGCKDTTQGGITIYPTPNPAFTASEECLTDVTSFTNNTTISSGSFTNSWNLGDGNSSSTAGPTHTYSGANTYSVKLISTSTSNGCKDSVTNSVTVNPLPSSIFSATNMCFGDTVPLTNSSTGNGLSYKWYFDDGNTSTSQNPIHVYTNSGTYTISLVVTSNKGCTDSSSTSVTVATQPLADFTFSDDCVHNTITFTNATSVACGTVSKYYWDYGDGNTETITSLTNPTHKYASGGTYNVQLVIELANSTKDTAIKTITIHAQPSANFNYSAACEGNLMQFTNTSSAQTSTTLKTFGWTFGDGGTSALKNPTNTYSSSGSYNVRMIVSDSRNCIDTVLKSLTVSPNPSADFSYVNNCAYDTVRFTNKSSVSSGSITGFAWDFGNNTYANTRQVGNVYGTAGYYQVKMVATSDAGCKDSVTKTVQAFVVPTSRFTASNVCDNESMSFNNLSSNASSYSWNFGDMSGTSTSSAPSYTYGSDGNYDVELISSTSNGCVDTFTSQVSVYSLPSASFSASNVCDGESVSFTNSSSGASSYGWSYGDGQGSSLSAPKHTYASAGAYTVQLIATSSNSCKDTTSNSITVNANPSVSISADDECTYDAVSFSNNTTGASTYAWAFGDGNTSTSSSPANKYAKAGTYKVVLTATSSASCATKDSIYVEAFPVPKASFTVAAACDGNASDFKNTSSISAGTMSNSWDFGDFNGTSNNTSPSYTYASANTYTAQLIATSNNGCMDTATANAVVNALPSPDFSFSNVCLGNSMSFSNSSSGASSYAWSFGDGNSSTSSAPSNTYSTDGQYTVTLEAKSSAGCTDDISKTVTVYALPTASFTATNECLGDDMTTTNLSSGASSYAWTFGDGNSSTSTAPTHNYATSGSYTVSLTATSSNSCTDNMSRSVTIYSLPAASFSAAAVCEGTATSFTNSTSGTNTYVWNFGDGTSSSLASPSKTYTAYGRYDVILTATSSNGCVDADTNRVTINEQPVAAFTATTECSGDSTSFTNNSTGTIFSHAWNFGNGNTSNSANPKALYTSGGNYNVSLSVSTAQGCNDRETVAVTVNSTPTAAYTVSDVCLTDDAMFSDDGSTGNGALIADREFIYGDGNNDFGRSSTYNYAAAGTYNSKMVVTTVNGCTDTASTDVVIFPMPEISIAGNDTCEFDAVQFINNSSIASGSIAAYQWNFKDGNVSTTEAPSHSFDTLGIYNVELTATSDNGCITVGTIDIKVEPKPYAQFVATEVCDGDSVRFQNHSDIARGSISFEWTLGDGSTSTDEHPWHEYDTFGVYDVTMRVTSNKACATEYQMSYEVHAQPIAALPLIPTCLGDSVLIPQAIRDLVNPLWSYSLRTNDTVITELPTGLVYAETGVYPTSLAIETPFGCYDSTTTDVVILEVPTINEWTYNRLENQELEFNATGTGDTTVFTWNFGDGTTADGATANHTFTAPGSYEVSCTVTNKAGCTDVISKTVDVFPTGILEITDAMNFTAYPNPFTDWVKFNYELKNDAYVRIEIIDMTGRLISTIVDGTQNSGKYTYNLDETKLPLAAGNAVVKVIVNDEVTTINLMKMK